MKRRAIKKDFYMEIRKSRGRFLSIFFIVAMGVAFFSGIRASEPDMRYSGDAYLDRNQLMDIQVLGTLGLTEQDAEALEALPCVEKAELGYSTDVLVDADGNQQVIRVRSIQETMNQYAVAEGRMPEKSGECLMDEDFLRASELKVGDMVTLLSGTKDPLKDTLKQEVYEIVGSGSSSFYLAMERGSSTVGNGSVNGFMAVLPEDFVLEVYTEGYVKVEDAEELTAFTQEYDDTIEAAKEEIEGIGDIQGKKRADEIREEAREELADAELELEEGKAEAEKELANAAKEIEDGEKQLKDGKQELEQGRKEIQEGKNQLYVSQEELDASWEEIEAGWAELEAGWAEFKAGEADFQQQYEAGMAEITEGEAQLAQAREELESRKAEYEAGVVQLEEAKQNLAQLEEAVQNPMLSEGQLLEIQAQVQGLQAVIAEQESKLSEAQAGLTEGEQTLAAKEQELQAGRVSLEDGAAYLEDMRSQLEASEAALVDGQNQAEAGQQEINAAWGKIKESEAELADGEKELAENEKKLEDGKKEYEEAKAEAEQEIKDGENEIKDAKLEIEKIEDAKWYVEDRSVVVDYTGYGENADRIRAIGEVFPILFFIVAALISLTTMTRMVEEQRTQIGTLKALGYSKFSIAGKYLNYALLATLGGSIFGAAIGEKIFPYVIIMAYKIMYTHIPDLEVPYNLEYALMAAGAAVACTGAAALLACYKELASQPAVLMRPPAPKQGKRVFLEKIPFLWKRLGFIWKSTIRNLIRYKKRFFMTVFGIGGCMALMIVGFGLRDSIFSIGTIQYKELQHYDIMVILNTDADEEDRTDLEKHLQEDTEITSISEGYMKRMNVQKGKEQREVYLYVPADLEKNEEFLVYRDRTSHESFTLGNEDVLLTEKMASLLEVEKGDTISIETQEGEYQELEITQICENYMENYLYLSPELYENTFGEPLETNTVYLKVQEEEEAAIQKIGEELLKERAALNVSYTYTMEAQLDDMLESLDLVIVVLIVSAGLLAFVVLYNLNNINITERKRELATIKVLGFYDKEVSAYVYRENILLTIIGTIMGIVLGSILHRYVIVTVEIDNVMFTRSIKTMSFALSALLTCVFSVFVNFVMYFKLKRINMVESLKSVE